METKNQYIEQYIKSISAQVNNQYGKELIDNDKISRALIMFKDSSEDLETEIIPKINKLVQQVINNYLEQQRKIEEIMKKQRELKQAKFEKLRKINLKAEENDNYQCTFTQIDINGKTISSNKIIEFSGKTAGKGYNAPKIVKYDGIIGYNKNSNNTTQSFDKFEYIICAFGKKLGVKMAETYKIYIDNNYMGIISEGIDKVGDIKYDASDLIKLRENNPNNFPIDTSGYDKIINEYKNLSNPNNIKMIGDSNYIVLDTTEDIEKAISLFPKIMSLFQISDEQKQKIEQDYFNMLVLDSVIGNVDRVMDNYGVVQRKNGKIEFSPLFDNATITIPDIPQQYAKINSYLIDKSRIMDVLYEKYYDKIKPITSQILEHRDEYYKFIKDISQKELNESEQRWFVEDTFNKNLDRICERERKQQLEVMPHQVQPQQFNKPKVKTLTRNSNDNSSGSKGFADAITLSLMVGFMCGILFIIVYILIKR